MTIATVTPNPSIDVSTAVDHVEPDRKLRCDEPRREPGGGGLNAARAIARLGGDALALWTIGGATGTLLHELLDAERLRHRPVPMAGMVRESVAVLEESSGRQYRFGTPGPTLPRDGLSALNEAVRQLDPLPAFVIGSGSLPPGADERFYATLAETVSGRGSRFILDTQGDALRHALATRRVSLIKPNRRELGLLLGRDLQRDADVEAAARSLIDDGACEAALVSLGAGGALLVTAGTVDRIVAPSVPVKSRIGAGDSTVAGLTLALSRGEPLARAARFGVAAGAAAVMTRGSELCRREDAEHVFSVIA